MYVCMYACMHACIHTPTYIHTYTHIHTYIHTYTHINTHIHTHINTHIHTHTYIHIYIYTCVHIVVHNYVLSDNTDTYTNTSKDDNISTNTNIRLSPLSVSVKCLHVRLPAVSRCQRHHSSLPPRPGRTSYGGITPLIRFMWSGLYQSVRLVVYLNLNSEMHGFVKTRVEPMLVGGATMRTCNVVRA